ncbi:MAG: nuclear transport factor 2 family protein [Candidatus Ranarchaeia archaeon]
MDANKLNSSPNGRISTEVDEIRKTIESYFDSLNRKDAKKTHSVWHDEARLYMPSDEVLITHQSFFEKLPNFVGFGLKQIERIDFVGTIASAKVHWVMQIPGSIGIHVSFFTLTKIKDKWYIINQTDYGKDLKK